MRRAKAASLAIMAIGVCGSTGAEVLPMTSARLAEAGELARRSTSEEALVYSGTCRTKGKYGLHMFEVSIMTPFGSVAFAAFTAKRDGTPFDLSTWPIEPPEKQRVIVSADPAASFPAGLPPVPPVNVDRVILRRGDQVVEALRADRHEVLFPEFDEKHRKYRGGAFYFPIEPFASTLGEIEVVVIPEGGEPGAEAVLKLKSSTLVKLR